MLQARADTPERRRKGERTRDRLKATAAQLLEKIGYRDMRVSDINEGAGVSNALFYKYFTNKQDITQEVLAEFLQTLAPDRPVESRQTTSDADAIYQSNLDYVRTFAANPGLMRCLIQFGDEIPEFGRLWMQQNDTWLEHMVRLVRHRDLGLPMSDAERLLTVAALGVMLDGLLRLLFVDRNPRIVGAAADIGDTPEAISLFLTRQWYRLLFGQNLSWSPDAD